MPDYVKAMMSGLSAAAWINRSARLEWRPLMFEVHIVRDRDEDFAGAGCVEDFRVQAAGKGIRAISTALGGSRRLFADF